MDENRSLVGFGAAIALLFALGATASITAAAYVDGHPPQTLPGMVLYLIGGGLIAVGTIAPFVAVSLRRARERRERQSCEEFDAIDAAAEKIQDKALGRLVSFNFRLMDRFINVALIQAKAAYLLCAVSACAALLVLLTGATALMAAATGTAQVTIGVLTLAGAALSGFISVTFMTTFRMTSRQMSYYYGQPLVHCYLLHAEWLAERAAHHGPVSAHLDHDLIRATLDAGRDAQHHLLELLTHQPGLVDRPPADDRDGGGGGGAPPAGAIGDEARDVAVRAEAAAATGLGEAAAVAQERAVAVAQERAVAVAQESAVAQGVA
jgi:hypothetical protein